MKKFSLLIFVLIYVSAGGWLETSAIGTKLLVTNTNDSGIGSLRYALETANNSTGHDTIHFAIPGDGPHTINLEQPLVEITDPVTIDAMTQEGSQCNDQLMIELNGQDAGERVNGLTILSHNVVVRGLVINRFSRHGIEILSPLGANTIECNFIGTDATGEIAQGNRRSGIVLNHSPDNTIGSVIPGMGNLISGNRQDGLVILGKGASQNVVIGNLIGTDKTGSVAIANAHIGLFIDKASHNYVGGFDDPSRNVISGNGWEGIYINDLSASYNVVTGNYIGTDMTGRMALGNSDSGIVISQASHNLIGGTAPGAGNVISANGRQGIYVFAPTANENTILGNYIGTDITGTSDLGNIGSGIFLDQTLSNVIGSEEKSHHNLIAANGEYGIYVYGLDWLDDWTENNTFGFHLSNNSMLLNQLAAVYVETVDESHDA